MWANEALLIWAWTYPPEQQLENDRAQCDKRLLHSIQESIRNVYAHEINLSDGTSCNITNLVKYGASLCARAFILFRKCTTKRREKANRPEGLFCQWTIYVFSSALEVFLCLERFSLFTSFIRKVYFVYVWFLLLAIIFQHTYSVCWSGFLFLSPLLNLSTYPLITLCGVNTKKRKSIFTIMPKDLPSFQNEFFSPRVLS